MSKFSTPGFHILGSGCLIKENAGIKGHLISHFRLKILIRPVHAAVHSRMRAAQKAPRRTGGTARKAGCSCSLPSSPEENEGTVDRLVYVLLY